MQEQRKCTGSSGSIRALDLNDFRKCSDTVTHTKVEITFLGSAVDCVPWAVIFFCHNVHISSYWCLIALLKYSRCGQKPLSYVI